MKNKLIMATLFSAFLLVSPSVKAANYTDNQTVDVNKVWTIKFTGEVGFDDLTKSAIIVTDSKGKTVDIKLSKESDNKTVLLEAPTGGYTPGENYTLTIGTKAHSKEGKSLKQERVIHFNIKSDDSKVINFPDKNLEKVIRKTINKPTGDILKDDVAHIKSFSAQDKNITDISGIQYLTDLAELDLSGSHGSSDRRNQISNIEPLKELKNLTKLNLSFNGISNINALKGLTNLTELNLSYNKLSDVNALSELENLAKLDLCGAFKNIKIDFSTSLGYILIDSNLEGLRELKNLTQLDLSYNDISNIDALKGLINLTSLELYDTRDISNIDALKGLTNLRSLEIVNTKITNLDALKELTNLTELNLLENNIDNIDGLKGLTNLKKLNLVNNKITNIEALRGLVNLTSLEISYNPITDVAPVNSYYYNLKVRDFGDSPILWMPGN